MIELGWIAAGTVALAWLTAGPWPLFALLFAAVAGCRFAANARIAGRLSAAAFAAWLVFSAVSETPRAVWLEDRASDAFNVLGDQFAQGKLYMPVDPDPRLALLANPYDPVEREKSGIPYAWDHSYYQGRYYLYWGIAPVVTVLMPFRLLTGRYLSELSQVLLFGLAAYLLAYWTALRWMRRWTGAEADAVERFLIAGSLAVCTELAATCRQIAIYQVSILACAAFVFAAYSALELPDRVRARAGIAGALFGLAIATRPTALTALLVLPALLRSRRDWLAVAIGMAPVGLGVAAYNFARFGDPLESGFFYQLGVTDMTRWGFSLRNELYALGAYLLTPLRALPEFPFYQPSVFGQSFLRSGHSYGFEAVYGLLPAAPFLLLLPLLARQRVVWRTRGVWLLIASGAAGLFLSGTAAVYRRYAVAFYPALVIAGWIALVHAERLQPRRARRVAIAVVGILALNQGIYASIAVYSSKFATARPDWYAQLRALLTG